MMIRTQIRLSKDEYEAAKQEARRLGTCPTLPILLRRTMHGHLRRSLPAARLRQAGRHTTNPCIPANTPAVFRGLRPCTCPRLD